MQNSSLENGVPVYGAAGVTPVGPSVSVVSNLCVSPRSVHLSYESVFWVYHYQFSCLGAY